MSFGLYFSKNVFDNIVIPFLYIPSLLTLENHCTDTSSESTPRLVICFPTHGSTEQSLKVLSSPIGKSFSVTFLESAQRWHHWLLKVVKPWILFYSKILFPSSRANHSLCSSKTHSQTPLPIITLSVLVFRPICFSLLSRSVSSTFRASSITWVKTIPKYIISCPGVSNSKQVFPTFCGLSPDELPGRTYLSMNTQPNLTSSLWNNFWQFLVC